MKRGILFGEFNNRYGISVGASNEWNAAQIRDVFVVSPIDVTEGY